MIVCQTLIHYVHRFPLSSRQYLVTFPVYPILDSLDRVLTYIVHGQVAPSCVENFHWNFDFHYLFVICEFYVLLL